MRQRARRTRRKKADPDSSFELFGLLHQATSHFRALGPAKAVPQATAKYRTTRPMAAASMNFGNGTETIPLPIATTLNGVGSTEQSNERTQNLSPSNSYGWTAGTQPQQY